MPTQGHGLLAELWSFMKSAMAIVLVQFSMVLATTLTVMRVGYALGTDALAGISLGVLTFNLTGLTLIMAPMSALDTKAPQVISKHDSNAFEQSIANLNNDLSGFWIRTT